MKAENYLLEQLKQRKLFNCDTSDCYQVLAEIMNDYANDRWISVGDPPKESGRYWCYLDEVNDLSISHYQWNCSYSMEDNRWGDTDRNKVTYWQPLPSPPNKEV